MHVQIQLIAQFEVHLLFYIYASYSAYTLAFVNEGYPNFAGMVLNGRMANEVVLRALHEATAIHFLPLLDDAHTDPFDSEVFLKNNVVSPTMDGCLLAISTIVSDLFAVELVEVFDKSEVLWHKDTRLFHLVDTEKTDQEGKPLHLGSIVFDPFRRPGKMKRSFVIPLRHRRDNNPPLVGLILDVVPPIWSDQSAENLISWEDAEKLFHEIGHVVQIILSKSSRGGICGAQNLSLELSGELQIETDTVCLRCCFRLKAQTCALTCACLTMPFCINTSEIMPKVG